MQLTARDRQRLAGVHPDLVRVIEIAAQRTFLSWFVSETLRSVQRQKELLTAKPPRTMTIESRHVPRLVMCDGREQLLGHAADLVLRKPNGSADWNFDHYHALGAEILEVAARQRVPMRWGGLFRNRAGGRFADGVHFELDASAYPLPPLEF